MHKVSVIIPVYNAEKYLRRCLNSVCGQSLKEIEIICIDDCSSDNSLEILKEYAKNYPNLKVLHLEKNGGESAARNAGLALATGEYLGFVDNDDEVDLNFFEKLYQKAHQENADIAKGQTIEITYNGRQIAVKPIADGADKWLFILYWWSAIYRRSMIVENNISFSTKHILGGDLLFLNQAVIAAKNLHNVDGVYYHYYRREDSGDSKILPPEKIESALDIYQIIIDNVNANAPRDNSIYNFIFHNFIFGCFYLALKAEDKKSKLICAKAVVEIFEKCHNQDSMQRHFATTSPHLFTLLKSRDRLALEDIIVNCKSRMELIACGLRAKIKK